MKLIKNFFERYPLRLWFMVLCAVIVQIVLWNQRNFFHTDEFVTFNILSGTFGDFMEKHDQLLSKDYIFSLLNNQNVSLAKIWHDLPRDVHLPAYFIILWIIKLFLSAEVSFVLSAQILNVLSLIGLLIGFYKLSCEIFKNKEVALASVFLFMFSAHVISLGILMRMYLLWIMLAVWQIYYTILFIRGQTDNRTLFFMGLFSFLQIFTHYYGFIFSFVLTGCTLFILLFNKNFVRRKLILFALTMLVSALMVFIIYPEMIDVIMYRHRGPEIWMSLQEWIKYPINTFVWRIRVLDDILPVSFISIVLFMLFLEALLFYFTRQKKITADENNSFLILMLLFFVYYILIMVIMPDVSEWHDNSFRYFALAFPIGFLLLVYFIVLLCRIVKFSYLTTALIILILAGIQGITSATLTDKSLYFQGFNNKDRLMKMVNGNDIWFGFTTGSFNGFLDGLYTANNTWILLDYENEDFVRFSLQEKEDGKYAYLLMPLTFENVIPYVIDWVKNDLKREAYYLFTMKNNLKTANSLEAIVIMVLPF